MEERELRSWTSQVKVAEYKRLVNVSANPPWPKILIPLDRYSVERSIPGIYIFHLVLFWCLTQCRKSHRRKSAEGGDLLDRLSFDSSGCFLFFPVPIHNWDFASISNCLLSSMATVHAEASTCPIAP